MFKSWLRKLEKSLESAGVRNPKETVKKHAKAFMFFYVEGIKPESVVENYLEDVVKNTYTQYLEKFKKSQSIKYSDTVTYKGKVMRRCPNGTKRVGNTCVMTAPQIPGINSKKQLPGNQTSRQIEKLAKAKTSKDVQKARKFK